MEIKYHPLVVRVDIPRLDKAVRIRIEDAIESKLAVAPLRYGIPLRHELRNLRKVRAGDYRIVFLFEGSTIFIVAIAHRKEIYKIVQRRN
ncbi:type II toxin-antitoxin system RelE/ParE family toxin [Candidatus Nomurabacteria bacterium]|nr:type II toxin-antitoxin system RelE/ParE family toxin [Candidatus Nomurabacteria bacterium]